jgi:hypothetical protein
MASSATSKRFGPNAGVLAVRLAILLLAVALAVAGGAVALRDKPHTKAATHRYSCPMHPEVSATTSGTCPICKMALEFADGSKVRAPSTVEGHPPDCPMHAKGSELTAKSTDSRATPMSAPSPEFAPGVTWLPETRPPAAGGTASERPILMTPKRRVVVDDVRAPAWLETPRRLAAVLYRDELVGLSKGESGRFFRAAAPRVPLEARLTDETPAAWDASTSVVHFDLEPVRGVASAELGATLRAGDVGWLEMARRSRELVVFPESALLRSSEGPYVLVPDAHGGFVRRSLQIGRILKGSVVLLSGLRDDERIVVSRPFFLDGEHGAELRAAPLAEARP